MVNGNVKQQQQAKPKLNSTDDEEAKGKKMASLSTEAKLFLIHQIHTHPAIWDQQSAEFRSNTGRQQAFTEVAQAMCDYIGVEDFTRGQVQEEWGKLRYCFTRIAHKKFSSGKTINAEAEESTGTTWPYWINMQFILESVRRHFDELVASKVINDNGSPTMVDVNGEVTASVFVGQQQSKKSRKGGKKDSVFDQTKPISLESFDKNGASSNASLNENFEPNFSPTAGTLEKAAPKKKKPRYASSGNFPVAENRASRPMDLSMKNGHETIVSLDENSSYNLSSVSGINSDLSNVSNLKLLEQCLALGALNKCGGGQYNNLIAELISAAAATDTSFGSSTIPPTIEKQSGNKTTTAAAKKKSFSDSVMNNGCLLADDNSANHNTFDETSGVTLESLLKACLSPNSIDLISGWKQQSGDKDVHQHDNNSLHSLADLALASNLVYNNQGAAMRERCFDEDAESTDGCRVETVNCGADETDDTENEAATTEFFGRYITQQMQAVTRRNPALGVMLRRELMDVCCRFELHAFGAVAFGDANGIHHQHQQHNLSNGLGERATAAPRNYFCPSK